MKQQVEISIVIPVYQAEQTLRSTLESVLAQSYRDYEVIIVDDGSTDGSSEIYESYKEQFHSCQIVRQKNSGASAARNNGIRQAVGKYIVFLDSDDLLEPTALECMIKEAEENHADLVIGNYVIFFDHENRENKPPWLNDMKSYGWMMNREDIITLFGDERTSLLGVCVWGKLYRRELIRNYGIEFPENVNYEEDCQFNIQYYKRISKAVRLRKVVNYYRIKEQSLSRTYHDNQFGFLVQGYNLRKKIAAEMGLFDLSEKIDMVFYTVVLMQIKKVSLTAMDRRKKRLAYQNILICPESKHALQMKRKDVSFFTRCLAHTCLKQRYGMIEFLLFLWKYKKKTERD